MVSHIWPRVRGSRPVVGSSRKISGGREIRLAARSSRRRMPPENCVICLSAASSSAEPAEQVARRSTRACLSRQPSSRPNSQRFSRAVRFSSTEAYWPVTPTSWRTSCGCFATSTPKISALAAVDRQQRGEHLEHRGLAGAVGAEHAEDLAAADLEVDAVDGAQVAEGLDEAVGRDGQLGRGGGVRVHEHDSCGSPVSPRLHTGFTAGQPGFDSLAGRSPSRLMPAMIRHGVLARSPASSVLRRSPGCRARRGCRRAGLDAAGADQHRGHPLVAQHPRQRELRRATGRAPGRSR